MEIRQGIGVAPGYAIGPAFVIDREEYRIERRKVKPEAVEAEQERVGLAFDAAVGEITRQLSRHERRLGPAAGILRAHITLLQDQDMREEISNMIRRQRLTAEYATSAVIRRRIKTLVSSRAQSFVERVMQDLTELEQSLLRHLLGAKREDISRLTKPVVVVAHSLSPTQTVAFDRTKILGLVTEVGGRTSHTAIVAASLGIPAVVGVEGVLVEVTGGDQLILDGGTGKVIVNPDEGTAKRYQAMEKNFQIWGRRLTKELRDVVAETKDGTRITILANIESPDEIRAALDYGAEGIGLYRTEFLYLDNNFEPTEEVHLEAYRRAMQLLDGRKIVIRTLDLGADKMPVDGIPRESNPFLGTRAIRLCLKRPDILKRQLRAIYKAAEAGPGIQIMIPMISSIVEVNELHEIIEEVKRERAKSGKPAPQVPVGAMIEVPSAAIITDLLCKHFDFFSIGTNDLIAYAIAVDRSNERVAGLYQPAHPAVLRMLKNIIDTANKNDKPVSVCGEMSGDVNYTLLLLGMGLRIFSVVPPAVPEIKKIIRSVTIEEAETVMKKAFEIGDGRKTADYLREATRKVIPDAV